MQTCTHSGVDCSVRSLWKALQVVVDEVLRKTTLQDLMRDEERMSVMVTSLGGVGFSLPVKST
jgi:DNA-binding IscR family transcriptional regulator